MGLSSPSSSCCAVVNFPVGIPAAACTATPQRVTVHIHISSPWRPHKQRTLRLAPGITELSIARLEQLQAVKAIRWATTAGHEAPEEDGYSELLSDVAKVPEGHQHVWIVAESKDPGPINTAKSAAIKAAILFAKIEAWLLLRGPLARRLVGAAARLGIQFAEQHWVNLAEVAAPVVAETILGATGSSTVVPAALHIADHTVPLSAACQRLATGCQQRPALLRCGGNSRGALVGKQPLRVLSAAAGDP